MKRIYYHGTSADNLESILKDGLKCRTPKLWHCSGYEIYLWDIEGVAKADDIDDDEQKIEWVRRAAIDSAHCAIIQAKDCRCVIIKVELDENEVYADTSCENMEGRGAVCIDRDILPHEIIGVEVSNDLSLLKGYFMALMLDNEYSNMELSPMEIKIAEAFKKAEIYPEDIDEMMEFQELSVNA